MKKGIVNLLYNQIVHSAHVAMFILWAGEKNNIDYDANLYENLSTLQEEQL